MMDLFQELRNAGKGIVLVTHDYNLLSHFDKHYLLEKEGLKLVD